MKITLCGSCKFEKAWKYWNELLTLRGHVVYSVAVLPSDKEGVKNWYSTEQKKLLDLVHLRKITESDAIFVIDHETPNETYGYLPYIGSSTENEMLWARLNGKKIFYASTLTPLRLANLVENGAIAEGDAL